MRRKATSLSPAVERVVRAAAFAARDGDRGRGEAAALANFAQLAQLSVPARGVLAPIDNAVIAAIHAVSSTHLGHDRVTRAFRRSLRRVKAFEVRDAVDTSHTDVLLATATAYYYAGLAWGLTYMDINRRD